MYLFKHCMFNAVCVTAMLSFACAVGCKGEPIEFVAQDMSSAQEDMFVSDTPDDMAACTTTCEGDQSLCDSTTGTCVECLSDDDCVQGLAHVVATCGAQGVCSYQCEDEEAWSTTAGVDIRVAGCDCEVSEEICDGLDNDCDGDIDELPKLDCEVQLGVCQGAVSSCQGQSDYSEQCGEADYSEHALEYSPDAYEALLCDGKDNDCDGAVDEACCGEGMAAKTHRVTDQSIVGSARFVPISPASTSGGAFAVAFLKDEHTVQVVEYDEHLNVVAESFQALPGERIKIFDIMSTPYGYMVALGFHGLGDMSDKGAYLPSMTFYEVKADRLTAEGNTALLGQAKTHYPFEQLTDSGMDNRITNFSMSNDGENILFVVEFSYGDHSLSTCSTTFDDIATLEDDCIVKKLLESEFIPYWGNNALFSDNAFEHELVVKTHNGKAAIFWAPVSSNGPVGEALIHTTSLDGEDWKTFNVTYNEGNFLGYRSSPRIVQWTDDDKVLFLYRNEDLTTQYFVSEVDPKSMIMGVAAREFPVIGSNERYLGVGLLDAGRDGSLDKLALLYRGSAVGGDLSIGLVQRDVSSPDTIIAAPVLMTDQRDEIDTEIPTMSTSWGMLSLLTYSEGGALELVSVNHEGDMICRL